MSSTTPECISSPLYMPRPIPPVSPGRVNFSTAVFASCYAFNLLCLAAFRWNKHKFERLRVRQTQLVVLMVAGCIMQGYSGQLGDLVGAEATPCWVNTLFSLLIVPIVGAVFVASQIGLFYMNKFSKGLLDYRSRIMEVDAAEFKTLELFSLALKAVLTGYQDEDQERAVRTAQLMMSRTGTAVVILLLLAPALFVVIGVFASDPVFLAGCTGCVLGTPVVVALVVEGLFIIFAGMYASSRSKQAQDPWGLKLEMRMLIMWSLSGIGFFLLSEFADVPDQAVFSFGFFVSLSLWMMTASMTLVPLFHAYFYDEISVYDDAALYASAKPQKASRSRSIVGFNQSDRSAMALTLTLQQVLDTPDLAAAFEQHLAAELGVESFYFVNEAVQWVHNFHNESEATRRARARKIVKAYIDVNGLYAVNVDSKTYYTIMNRYKSNEFPVDMFEEAKSECRKLLERGALFRFEKSKEAQRALAALRARPHSGQVGHSEASGTATA